MVFSSKKLSVLVADPKNTKVNIDPEPLSVKPSLEMAQHDQSEFTKNPHSPMETLMSQVSWKLYLMYFRSFVCCCSLF